MSVLKILSHYAESIRPYWDEVAKRLQKGNDYGVLKQLERLKENERLSKQTEDEIRTRLRQYKLLYDMVRQDGERLGYDHSLFDTLGTPALDNPDSKWTWSAIGTSWGDDNDSEAVDWNYHLMVSEELKDAFQVLELPKSPEMFSGKMTWMEVITQVHGYGEDESKKLQQVKSYQRLLKFRISLIEAVLWEYDSFGYPPLYDELDPAIFREAVADYYALYLVRLGLGLVDDPGARFSNRNRLTSAMAEKTGHGETKRIQELLSTRNLYPSKEGPGRPTKEEEKRLFDLMIKGWREFLRLYNSGNGEMAENGG